MPSEDGNEDGREQGGGLGRPVLIGAILAAGVAAAFGGKALLDARKKDGSDTPGASGRDNGEQAQEDLPTVLRRAALDVAFAATSQAAERLERPTAGAAKS